MADKVICDKIELVGIADALRECTGSTETFNVEGLSDEIETISSEIDVQMDLIEQILSALERKGSSKS